MTDTLKPGDRIQVVLVVKDGLFPDSDFVHVNIEGGTEVFSAAVSDLTHGTRLPPKPKPLAVGDRVQLARWYPEGIDGEIVGISGVFAWVRYAERREPMTESLSDLTRIEDTPT